MISKAIFFQNCNRQYQKIKQSFFSNSTEGHSIFEAYSKQKNNKVDSNEQTLLSQKYAKFYAEIFHEKNTKIRFA